MGASISNRNVPYRHVSAFGVAKLVLNCLIITADCKFGKVLLKQIDGVAVISIMV